MDSSVVRTESGDYVQVFKLAGASFESADDHVLNNWHERLNVLWRNIATANTALWVHVVRRRESPKAAPGRRMPVSRRGSPSSTASDWLFEISTAATSCTCRSCIDPLLGTTLNSFV